MIAFSFDLEDVAICLGVPHNWASLRLKEKTSTDGDDTYYYFCRLDLTRSRLTYDSFSCGRKITDLSCTAATFMDTRFEGKLSLFNLTVVSL